MSSYNYEIIRDGDPIREMLLDVNRIIAQEEHAAACALWGLNNGGEQPELDSFEHGALRGEAPLSESERSEV